MQLRRLGTHGPWVSALGLGCMGMSEYYGYADDAESVATIQAALDHGVTLLDTGDFYGMGDNELLIRRALTGRPRGDLQISVKFGAQRDPSGAYVGFDASPQGVKNALAYTLRRLGTDYVDIYRPARLDPVVPIEDTVGAIADLVTAGYVRYVGLSEVGAQTATRAASVHPICDLQIEYSLVSRGLEPEILPACRALGVGITAYGVLSRGLISGHWDRHEPLSDRDFRTTAPRFIGDNLVHNLALVDALREVAADLNGTVAQVAIAWVASRGDDIVPLIGARTRERLKEALGALALPITPAQSAQVEAAIPAAAVAGTRYPDHSMANLDSERSPTGRAEPRHVDRVRSD